MTFSFIVPVYNTEKYLAKCLDSLLSQTDPDFEIIVVNDGSPDNSQAIIDDYAARYPSKIKGFVKENGGLSDARNYGIERASGEYFLLIDSDDYIDPKTLEHLRAEISHCHPDMIGFHLPVVNADGVILERFSKLPFSCLSGEDATISLAATGRGYDSACGFTYRRAFWKQQGFAFIKGIYHEDFALVPLAVLRAEKVSCIDFDAYYYVSTEGSIMRAQTPEKIRKRAQDLLTAYDHLVDACRKQPPKNRYAEKMYLHYAAVAALYRLNFLDGELKQWFRKEVRRRHVAKNLMTDTLKRMVRAVRIRLKHRV